MATFRHPAFDAEPDGAHDRVVKNHLRLSNPAEGRAAPGGYVVEPVRARPTGDGFTVAGRGRDPVVPRYPFRFDPRFRPALLPFGVVPGTAYVDLDDGRLRARFGPWVVETTVANVTGVHLTGPYHWWFVLGTHLSLTDRGLTFGTNSRQGVCLTFHEPVTGIDPIGRIRHPGLTVTVAEPDRFAAAVEQARQAV